MKLVICAVHALNLFRTGTRVQFVHTQLSLPAAGRRLSRWEQNIYNHLSFHVAYRTDIPSSTCTTKDVPVQKTRFEKPTKAPNQSSEKKYGNKHPARLDDDGSFQRSIAGCQVEKWKPVTFAAIFSNMRASRRLQQCGR